MSYRLNHNYEQPSGKNHSHQPLTCNSELEVSGISDTDVISHLYVCKCNTTGSYIKIKPNINTNAINLANFIEAATAFVCIWMKVFFWLQDSQNKLNIIFRPSKVDMANVLAYIYTSCRHSSTCQSGDLRNGNAIFTFLLAQVLFFINSWEI